MQMMERQNVQQRVALGKTPGPTEQRRLRGDVAVRFEGTRFRS
jgi:hypothetical protein